MEKEFDIVTIGDVVVDAFIKLHDAHIVGKTNDSTREICMTYGSKLPFESVKVIAGVGNSANAAVSASRLGLKAAFYAPTGDDANGQLCIDTLAKDAVDTRFIDKQSGIPTNYHYVLWFGDERTILIKHEDYKYKLPDMGNPRYLYLSSLGENAFHIHGEVVEYLKSHPQTKLAFQPGTFQIKAGVEKLADIYKHTKIFVCNLDEAKIITETNTQDVRVLAEKLMSYGPKIILITDGANGAYSYDGKDLFFMPTYPDPKAPLERTGAGDAFASTFVSFIALGMRPEEALKRAPINSMSVVQCVGAQEGLLSREKLEEYLTNAPTEYVSKQM